MKLIIKLFLYATLLGVSLVYADRQSLTESEQKGKELHKNYCVFCHLLIVDETLQKVYHSIEDYPGLEKKVLTCVNELGLHWDSDEVGNVTTYLNKTYYQFDLVR